MDAVFGGRPATASAEDPVLRPEKNLLQQSWEPHVANMSILQNQNQHETIMLSKQPNVFWCTWTCGGIQSEQGMGFCCSWTCPWSCQGNRSTLVSACCLRARICRSRRTVMGMKHAPASMTALRMSWRPGPLLRSPWFGRDDAANEIAIYWDCKQCKNARCMQRCCMKLWHNHVRFVRLQLELGMLYVFCLYIVILIVLIAPIHCAPCSWCVGRETSDLAAADGRI